MLKISITKNSTITHSAKFETQEMLEQWLAKHEKIGTFGTPAHTVQLELTPAIIGENGEVIQEATFEEVNVPADYTYEIIDISAQIQAQKNSADARKFLADTDWKILRHQDQQALGIATSLTAQEFFDLLQERQAAREAI